MFVGSTVQIVFGKYRYCIGTIIAISKDDVVLVELDDELTISCDVSDVEVLSA